MIGEPGGRERSLAFADYPLEERPPRYPRFEREQLPLDIDSAAEAGYDPLAPMTRRQGITMGMGLAPLAARPRGPRLAARSVLRSWSRWLSRHKESCCSALQTDC
jgi:hypothetical protein